MRLLCAVLVSLTATVAGAHASSFVVLGDAPLAHSPSFVTLGAPAPAPVAAAAPKTAAPQTDADRRQLALADMAPASWKGASKPDADAKDRARRPVAPIDWQVAFAPAALAEAGIPISISQSIVQLGNPAPPVTDETVASIPSKDPFFTPMVIRGGLVGGASAAAPANLSVPMTPQQPQAVQPSQSAVRQETPQPANDQRPSPTEPAAPPPAPLPPNGYRLPSPS